VEIDVQHIGVKTSWKDLALLFLLVGKGMLL
jgi:hypothetical protein